MGKSILELFQTKPLGADNSTAQEKYSVRNSKEIPVSTNSTSINKTSVVAYNKLRQSPKLTNRYSETILEEELTGLRILRLLSMPIIYGGEIGRLTSESTNVLNIIKSDTNNGPKGLNKLVSKLRDNGNNFLSKVGVKFPQLPIPTVVRKELSGSKRTSNTMQTLSKVLKDSTGNTLGLLLKSTVSGDVDSFGRNLIGAATNTVKSKIRNVLRGKPDSSIGITGTNYYDNIAPYESRTMLIRAEKDRMYAISTSELLASKIGRALPRTSISDDVTLGIRAKLLIGGSQLWQANSPKKFVAYEQNGTLYKAYQEENRFNIDKSYQKSIQQFTNATENFKIHLKQGDIEKTKKQILDPDKSNTYNENKKYKILVVPSPNAENLPLLKYDNDTYMPDFINVVIHKIGGTSRRLISTVTNISDSYNAEWTSDKFVGNVLSHYTYEGYSRDIGFDLTLFAENQKQHTKMWDDIRWLQSLVKPQKYTDKYNIPVPTFVKVTVGSMWKDLHCYVNDVGVSIDETAGWSLSQLMIAEGGKIPRAKESLPLVCTVSLRFTVIVPDVINNPAPKVDDVIPEKDKPKPPEDKPVGPIPSDAPRGVIPGIHFPVYLKRKELPKLDEKSLLDKMKDLFKKPESYGGGDFGGGGASDDYEGPAGLRGAN
jgi:hypothetical protein